MDALKAEIRRVATMARLRSAAGQAEPSAPPLRTPTATPAQSACSHRHLSTWSWWASQLADPRRSLQSCHSSRQGCQCPSCSCSTCGTFHQVPR
jgi:hypothetical protein